MKIVFEIAGIIIVYFLGYLIGFKAGVTSIIEQLNKMTKEILDKAKEVKKENNIIKECEYDKL